MLLLDGFWRFHDSQAATLHTLSLRSKSTENDRPGTSWYESGGFDMTYEASGKKPRSNIVNRAGSEN